MSIKEKIFDAGVVGAGGAGFPSHIKAGSRTEFVLANGAECEPLIHKDFELMVNFPGPIVRGLEKVIESTNAKLGYFGIKSKNAEAIEAIKAQIGNKKIKITDG
jgi:Na+-translocating ferredoxin:NAD+ oxidoreductase RnfC subunit